MNNVHFKSNKHDWETPQDLFDNLNQEFNFTLDVCAKPENAKCKEYFTPSINGLLQNWKGVCWMNPPYGREIKNWMKKAFFESHKHNIIVVCLVPSRTDTKWWHDYVMKSSEIRFVKGRLHFSSSKDGAPFPSAIIVFNSSIMVEQPQLIQQDTRGNKICTC